MTQNPLEDLGSLNNKFTEKIKNALQQYFPFIMLVVLLVLNVAKELFETHLNNPLTPQFFVSYAQNVLITMFPYVVFTWYKDKKYKLTSEEYKKDKEEWIQLSTEVRENMADRFYAYCREQLQIEREDKRKELILNNTLISWETYNEKYRGKTYSELHRAYKYNEFNYGTFLVLLKANKQIKLKPINPLIILCGVHAQHLNDAGREKVSSMTGAIIARPITMFFTTFCFCMLSGTFIGIQDKSVIYGMITSAIMIILSSIFGCSAGEKSALKEHDRIKARTFYLEKFKKAPIPIDKPEEK